MIFFGRHDDDETEDEEALNDLDDMDGALDDSVLDELEVDDTAIDETAGFGRLEEDGDEEDEEEDEEDEAGDEALPEEDAEDVDYDTFDDVDEM